MKKFLILLLTMYISTIMVPFSFAADSLEVIPSAKTPDKIGEQVDCVGGNISKCKTTTKPGTTVRDRYNTQAKEYDKGTNGKPDTGASFASGIFTRDTIIEYIVYVIKFISQIGLLIGVMMIIYAGYKYATAVFTGKTPSSDMIKDAIIGVLIVIFSYAIIKALTSAFL